MLWKHRTDYTAITAHADRDALRAIGALKQVETTRTTSSEVTLAAQRRHRQGSTANVVTIPVVGAHAARKEGFTALRKLAELLGDDLLPPQQEDLLLRRANELISAINAKDAEASAGFTSGGGKGRRGSYLSAALALSTAFQRLNGTLPYECDAMADAKIRKKRSSSGKPSRRSSSNLSGTEGVINPWIRFVEDRYVWPHEEALSHALMRELRQSSTSRSKAAGARPVLAGAHVRNSKGKLLSASAADSSAETGPATPPWETCSLYMEENELASSALNFLDSSAVLNADLTAPSSPEQSPLDAIGNRASALRQSFAAAIRRGNSHMDPSRSASRASTAPAAKRHGVGKRHEPPSLVSKEYNDFLVEYFGKIVRNDEHPVRRCICAFVEHQRSFIRQIFFSANDVQNTESTSNGRVEKGGGAEEAVSPTTANSGQVMMSWAEWGRLGQFSAVEYSDTFLIDRIFFSSALCDHVALKMFASRGIPFTIASGLSVMSPNGSSPQQDSVTTPSSTRSTSAFADLTVDDGVRSSSSTTFTSANANITHTLDLTQPVREALAEMIDAQVEIEALYFVLFGEQFSWELIDPTVPPTGDNGRLKRAMSDALKQLTRTMKPMTHDPWSAVTTKHQRSMLEGVSGKLHEQFHLLVLSLPEVRFVVQLYELLIDLLVTTYNVVEFAAVTEPGVGTGADGVFPLLVAVVSICDSYVPLYRLLRWLDSSPVAKRIPLIQSKGIVSYVLLSFRAAMDAVVGQPSE